MELRSLKYFQAAYELNSISGAAKKCFVSQPSITVAIKHLEDTLDVQLFLRHARGVIPTAAANKLYPLARKASDNIKTILNIFDVDPAPVTLRLGIMRSLGSQRMSYLLKQLMQQIDHLELTLVEPDEPCDARIILSHSKTQSEIFVPFWQDNYYLAIPRLWSLAQRDKITIANLDKIPFINRCPCDVLDKLKEMMLLEGVELQSCANIKTIEYAWQLVNAGIGAALLPDWKEITEADGLTLKPIENVNFYTEIGLAFKSGLQNHSMIKSIKEVCLKSS